MDGRTLFAKWNPGAWEAIGRGPAATLAKALEGRSDREALLTDYLTLAREAVGLQYVDTTSFAPARPPTFVATCWIDLLPRLLPTVPPNHTREVLALLWNAGERLIREPVWLTRYLTGCIGKLTDLSRFEPWLRESLTPVLQELPTSSWTGPMTCTIVDCRPFHEDFLPGTLHLAAPAVACIHDRRQDRIRLGLLLRPDRASLCFGRTPCLGEFPPPKVPAVTVGENTVRIGTLSCPVPHFGPIAGFAVSPAGYVIAALQNSQCLWIVEVP